MLLVSNLDVGGAERHTVALANQLCERFDIVLVSLKPTRALAAQAQAGRLRAVECLDIERRVDAAGIGRLAALIEAHHVRVVLCTNAYPLLYAQLARLRHRLPVRLLEVFHTTVLPTWRSRLKLWFYRPLFWTASGLVFVCQAQRDYCVRRAFWSRRMEVIYNGVDTEHFDASRCRPAVETRARYGWDGEDRVVGLCAVFRPEKAHGDLLRAVHALKQKGLPWKVLLIGDGPTRRDVEREIERLGLQDDVRITGYIADVRDAIVACDLIALVSTAVETFSIAALEAMALGRPLVMSRTGGAAEQVVEGVNGRLFEPGDVAALAECLESMSDRSGLASMGTASRKRVETLFAQREMVDRYAGLVMRLAA